MAMILRRLTAGMNAPTIYLVCQQWLTFFSCWHFTTATPMLLRRVIIPTTTNNSAILSMSKFNIGLTTRSLSTTLIVKQESGRQFLSNAIENEINYENQNPLDPLPDKLGAFTVSFS